MTKKVLQTYCLQHFVFECVQQQIFVPLYSLFFDLKVKVWLRNRYSLFFNLKVEVWLRNHYSLFTSLRSKSASAHSQRSRQCCQHRNDNLNQCLPKFLVLHTLIFFSTTNFTNFTNFWLRLSARSARSARNN